MWSEYSRSYSTAVVIVDGTVHGGWSTVAHYTIVYNNFGLHVFVAHSNVMDQEVESTAFTPSRGKLQQAACDTARDKYGGVYGPFELLS